MTCVERRDQRKRTLGMLLAAEKRRRCFRFTLFSERINEKAMLWAHNHAHNHTCACVHYMHACMCLCVCGGWGAVCVCVCVCVEGGGQGCLNVWYPSSQHIRVSRNQSPLHWSNGQPDTSGREHPWSCRQPNSYTTPCPFVSLLPVTATVRPPT